MQERVNFILAHVRAQTSEKVKKTLNRWKDCDTPDEQRIFDMELLASLGLDPVLRDTLTAYGDMEVVEALQHVYTGMSVPFEPEYLVNFVKQERKRVENSFAVDKFFSDDEGYPTRMQPSERYLRQRRKTVKSWSMEKAFRFGIDILDREIGGVQPGEICVVAGAQGSMKTSFVIGGMEDALAKGMSVMFFSLDMDAGEIQERRILRRTRYSQTMYFYLEQENDDSEINKAQQDIIETDRGIFRLYGNDGCRFNVDSLCERIYSERPQVMILDYLTLLAKPNQTDLQCVNECMDAITTAVKKSGTRAVLLSQMGRESKRDQATGMVGGHSKGGGKVEERAYVEIELFKDSTTDVNSPQIIATITKNRRGPDKISFSLDVDATSMTFTGGAQRVWRNSKKPVQPLFTKDRPTEAAQNA
jgi:hypothetical protein